MPIGKPFRVSKNSPYNSFECAIQVRRGKGGSFRLHYQAAKAGAFAYIVRQLDLEDLSRIHDVIGVDRLLDCTHDAHRFAVLGDQKVEFAAADPVLACAGAVE
jgi:hypothetical protein